MACAPIGCNRSATPTAANADELTVPVTLATAMAEDVPIQVKAIGWVEAYATVTIRPQIEGQIIEIHFKEGQLVKEGDLLFRIDPRPFEAALRLAEANLLKDQAMAADAEREARRVEELFAKASAADRERDQTRANAEAARAQVQADQAAVENAKLRLEYCSIRSPIEGRAGARLVDRGNIVKANETSLVTINQLHPIYVTFAVAERHLQTIKQQRAAGPLPVEIDFTDEDRPPVRGELTFIDNQVDTTSGMVRLKATVSNEDFVLWPGRFVNAALTISVLHDAVVVPAPAVQTGQQGAFIFVVRTDNTVEFRTVSTGPTVGEKTVITSGVQAGEMVVTDGQLRLVPGAKVRAVESKPEKQASTQ